MMAPAAAMDEYPADLTATRDCGVDLSLADGAFGDWSGLLGLIHGAFAQNAGRTDPPSTVFESTVWDLMDRAKHEQLMLASDHGGLVGCLFMRRLNNQLFLGRFAILPRLHGSGLARRMVAGAEQIAIRNGLDALTLEVRVELRENQRKFAALGFEIVGGRAHSGYDRVTTLKMKKDL